MRSASSSTLATSSLNMKTPSSKNNSIRLILNITYTYLIHEIPSDPYFYTLILIIAVVFTVLPLFLNLFALNRIDSATIGILMYINPLFNFSIAFLVFGETINTMQIIGYSIILLALLLFNYSNVKKILPSGATKA